MTDIYHSLTVVLESDTRDNDAQPLIDAIKQLKGVIEVSGNVTQISDHVAHTRLRIEYSNAILDLLQKEIKIGK